MANWSFLINHARVLMCIAHGPGARLGGCAASLGITERSAYGIAADLTKAGYVIRQKDGRRDRYQIQASSRGAGCRSSVPQRNAGEGSQS